MRTSDGYDWTPSQLRVLKHKCEESLLFFTRYFFKLRTGQKFIVNRHHRIVCETLEKVLRGDISRLIINIPPGYTKTELAVISFVAWGMAHNSRSKFIHTSCADDLIILNSTEIRRTITLPEYQQLWPMQIRQDRNSSQLWYTEQGGGMRVAPSGGTVTGFRAGQMEMDEGFTGAIIIDDPQKPEDVFSDAIRKKLNRRITNTIKSRLALESIPIILIMQRLHDDDTTAHLLQGNSGDQWYHLEMGVDQSDKTEYPSEWISGKPIKYIYSSGPLWRYKHDEGQIKILKTDEYTYNSQYQQRPAPEGGSIFRPSWFPRYTEFLPVENQIVLKDESKIDILYKTSYSDTAMKTGEQNDFSVFQTWGYGEDDKIYLLDQARGKWEAPDLEERYILFLERHRFVMGKCGMSLRAAKVEDKASGTGLIQGVNRRLKWIKVEGIPRDKDKVSRARSGAPSIKSGNVVLPEDAFWLDEYLYEFEKFTPFMTHKHDDQIDPTLDAIHDMLLGDTVVHYDRLQ